MSTLHIRLSTIAILFLSEAVCAQTISPSTQELDARLEASNHQLREAMIGLRDVRLASCKFKPSHDCDLANIIEIEITLLELESKYRRAAKASHTERDIDLYTKIKDAASDARRQVSDLSTEILIRNVPQHEL